MGTSQLALYNGALRLIKDRRLASLADTSPARYLLDDSYSQAIADMLEMGQWAFASSALSIAGTVSANRGYAYRFTKPADYVRLISISASSSYYPPTEAFAEDNTYFYANDSILYFVFVSSDAARGGDLAKWPSSFASAVEAYLAVQIAPHLTKADGIIGRVGEMYDDLLARALAKDTINRTSRVVSSATLGIYNGALRLLGKRLITNFDDRTVARRIYDASGKPGANNQPGQPPSMRANDVEAEMVLRRLLDEAYDDAVEYMLSQGLWNFASRTVSIESSTSVEPEFGYAFAFEKPDDFVRLVKIAATGTMWPTLEDYEDEGGFWNANVDPLFAQYVSNGVSYGRDLSLWPITVKKALEAYLALQIAMDPMASMSGAKIEALQKHQLAMLRDARTKDAMNQAATQLPPGRLSMARSGGRRDLQRRQN